MKIPVFFFIAGLKKIAMSVFANIVQPYSKHTFTCGITLSVLT